MSAHGAGSGVPPRARPAIPLPDLTRRLLRRPPADATYALAGRTRRYARVAVVLVAAVTVGSGARFALHHAYLEPRLVAAVKTSHGVAAAHASMLDQETGVRGYLLTGDRAYLEPYYRGQEAFLDSTASTSATLPEDVALRAAFRDMDHAAMMWMTRYAGPATAPPPPAGTRPSATPASGLGKQLFDDYRVQQSELIRHSEQHVVSLLASQRRLSDLLTMAELLVGSLLVVALVARYRRLQAELFAPLAEIDDVAAGLAQGRLETAVQLTGNPPVELRSAAARLELLRARLVRQERQLGAERLATTRRIQLHQQVLRHSADFGLESDLSFTCTAIVGSTADLSGCRDVSLWMVDGRTLRPADPAPDDVLDERAERILHSASRFGREQADVNDDSDLLALPLVAAGRTIAVLLLRGVSTVGDGPDRLDAVRSLAAHAAAALDAARLHQEVLTASLRDELTGLWNRRRFNEDLPREAGLASRHGHPLSLLMLDLDRFKAFNDTHGHPAGDALLRELAMLLRESLRDGDAAYRLGGEEFAVLLSHDDESSGRQCGERLRELVETRLARRGVTVSVGVAALVSDGECGQVERDALVRRADEALYAAKNGGRNRVVSDSELVPVPVQREAVALVEAGR